MFRKAARLMHLLSLPQCSLTEKRAVRAQVRTSRQRAMREPSPCIYRSSRAESRHQCLQRGLDEPPRHLGPLIAVRLALPWCKCSSLLYLASVYLAREAPHKWGSIPFHAQSEWYRLPLLGGLLSTVYRRRRIPDRGTATTTFSLFALKPLSIS